MTLEKSTKLVFQFFNHVLKVWSPKLDTEMR